MWSIAFYLLFLVSHAVRTTVAYETVKDAAQLARKLVDLSTTSIGTMATVYPDEYPVLAGKPFALQEYYASCHDNGSLTLLFLPISRHSQNVLHSPGHSASLSVSSEYPAASRARVSLIGNITILYDTDDIPDLATIQTCYLEKHPDAVMWLPGDDAPHASYWARFDPERIYFVGGFGDEHYIGDIPVYMYQEASVSDGHSIGGIAGRVLVDQYQDLHYT